MPRSIQWHNIEGSPVIVTENVFEYRRCIAEYVTSTDVVLEVGCAEGLTTLQIARHAKQAFGIDKSPSQIAKAISRHQQQQHNLSFHQVEAWDLNTVLKVAAAAGVQFSVVFIDVSGSRRVGDIDNLVMKYEQVFNPSLFIVKSYQLKRLINRCQLFFCASNHKQQLAGSTAEQQEESDGSAGADAAADARPTVQEQQQQHNVAAEQPPPSLLQRQSIEPQPADAPSSLNVVQI